MKFSPGKVIEHSVALLYLGTYWSSVMGWLLVLPVHSSSSLSLSHLKVLCLEFFSRSDSAVLCSVTLMLKMK